MGEDGGGLDAHYFATMTVVERVLGETSWSRRRLRKVASSTSRLRADFLPDCSYCSIRFSWVPSGSMRWATRWPQGWARGGDSRGLPLAATGTPEFWMTA